MEYKLLERIKCQLYERLSYLQFIEPDEPGECYFCDGDDECDAHQAMRECRELIAAIDNELAEE